MWGFEKKEEYAVAELVRMVSYEDVEGITILGGEPLDQFDEVLQLCTECKRLGLSIMVFTGYELDEIENSEKKQIQSVADILIIGRYMENLRTIDHQWIGSTNQRILFLTERYKDFEIKDSNYMEIDIDENGRCTILGFPTEDFIRQDTLLGVRPPQTGIPSG